MKKAKTAIGRASARGNARLATLAVVLSSLVTTAMQAVVVGLQDDFNRSTIDTTTRWDITNPTVQESADQTHAEFLAGNPKLFAKTTFNQSPTSTGEAVLTLRFDISGFNSAGSGYAGLNSALGGNNILLQNRSSTGNAQIYVRNTSTGTDSFYDLGFGLNNTGLDGTWEIDWSNTRAMVLFNGVTKFDSAVNAITSGSNGGTTTWNIPTVAMRPYFEQNNGAGVIENLDNVLFVPEPSAVVLCGLASLAFIGRRKTRYN